MKYLIYLRVSTQKQDTETQLDHCLRFIKQRDKSDFKYVVFSDKITSRKMLTDREGGKALFEAMEKGDIVIAMRLDRLTRKLHETTDLIRKLDENGAEVILVEQPGINNKILLGLYAGMAEEEVKLIRKRICEKLQSKKNRGERVSGKLPYGYSLHETKLVPIRVDDDVVMKKGILVEIPDEQEVLAQMCRLFDQGMSYRSIAKELSRLGYRNRQGNPFQHMSIYRILCRIGRTRLGGQLQEEIRDLLYH